MMSASSQSLWLLLLVLLLHLHLRIADSVDDDTGIFFHSKDHESTGKLHPPDDHGPYNGLGNGNGYRLGDIVGLDIARKNQRKTFNDAYPNSMASEYMRRTNENNRIDVLEDIVDEYIGIWLKSSEPVPMPSNNTLVIHIRLGDVLEFGDLSVDDFLREQQLYYGLLYVRPLSYYEGIIKTLLVENETISHVLLVGGYHLVEHSTKSQAYANRLQLFLEEQLPSAPVTQRINQNADDDFVLMCNAAYFVPSGGRFSKLVAMVVEHRSNHVIMSMAD